MSSATIPFPTRRRSRLLGIPPSELTFSVLTGEHQGRQVSIRGAKCTIGSAAGCTLRLRAPGVRPLHCWILRGTGGTIVRRRHRDTNLNGHAFDDAALLPGDRLRIGSVELEVVACPVLSPDWTAASAEPAPIYDERDRALWERAARESSESIDRLRAEMQDLERRATSQLADLNELIGRVSSERDSLQEKLHQGEFQSQSQRDTLLAEKQQLAQAVAAGQQELAELRTHLTTREVEIEAVLLAESRRVAEMQTRLEEVLRERTVLEAHLQNQSDSLQGQSTIRQLERDRLEEECQRLDTQLAQLRELVGYTAAERDQLTLHMDDAQRHLLNQQEQLHQEKLDLQRRLDAAHAELSAAQRRLAVIEVEGDGHLQSELERTSHLQQQLDQLEFEKSELQQQLRQQASTLQAERGGLSEQQERLGEQCRQLDGQLTHLRDLVESQAAERDSLCQQLETADLRQAADQEQFQTERAALAQQLATAAERLAGQEAQADAWQRQAADLEEQVRQTCEQLAEANSRLAQWQATGQQNSEIESGLAAKWEAAAESARDELAAIQMQLADAATRLAAEQAQAQSHLQAEREQRAEWERRAGELQYKLTSAEMQVAGAEDRLAGLQSQGQSSSEAQNQQLADWERRLAAETERALRWEEKAGETLRQLAEAGQQLTDAECRLESLAGDLASRTQAESERSDELAQRAGQWEQRAGEVEAARAALETQLTALNDAVRFERETWQHDRDRLHQECRMLGHRLIQKQKDLDALQDKVRAASAPQATQPGQGGQMTITMDQINRQVEAAATIDEERSAWEAERFQLRRQIDELAQQLAASTDGVQGQTLVGGLAALAEPRRADERVADLELQLEAVRCELEESRARHQQAISAAGAARDQHSENQQLRGEIALLQRELETARSTPTAPEAAGDAQQLVQLQQHHEQQHETLTAQREALAAERTRLKEEAELAAAAQQEAEAQRAELSSAQAEFEGRWREWEETLRSKEQLLGQQAEELDARLERAAAKLAELQQQQEVQAQREDELREAAAQLAQRRANLDHRQAELDRAPDEVDRQPAERPSTASPSRDETEEVNQVLGQLVQTGVWRGDEPAPAADQEATRFTADEPQPKPDPHVPEHCAAQFAASATPSGETPKPVWNQPGEAAPPADDDSIEAYMSRLLKRVRGDAPGAAPTFTPQAPTPVAMPASEPELDEPVNMTVEVQIEPVKPEEYLPRQKAPELTTNLAAMRQVANSAARTAIVKHQKSSGNKQALVKSVGAVLTLICGGAAGYLAYRFHSLPAGAAAAIGLAAALYWGGKAALHALRVMMLKAPAAEEVELYVPAADSSAPEAEAESVSLDTGSSLAVDDLPLDQPEIGEGTLPPPMEDERV